MDDQAAFCVKCGVAKGMGNNYCQNCGRSVNPGAVACTMCGAPCTPSVNPAMQKSKLVAGLLGIFVGGLGIHNFYLGNNSRAVLQIVLSFVACGAASLWGFIEGIMILCGNINTDANGVPLGE